MLSCDQKGNPVHYGPESYTASLNAFRTYVQRLSDGAPPPPPVLPGGGGPVAGGGGPVAGGGGPVAGGGLSPAETEVADALKDMLDCMEGPYGKERNKPYAIKGEEQSTTYWRWAYWSAETKAQEDARQTIMRQEMEKMLLEVGVHAFTQLTISNGWDVWQGIGATQKWWINSDEYAQQARPNQGPWTVMEPVCEGYRIVWQRRSERKRERE